MINSYDTNREGTANGQNPVLSLSFIPAAHSYVVLRCGTFGPD